MLETNNTRIELLKEVPIMHPTIIEYLKTVSGSFYTQTSHIKISTKTNKVTKLNLQVYRREEGVWQTGNTDNVYIRYKFYNESKSPLTSYIDVPAGELVSKQYVLVSIDEVPEDAKYIRFELSMKGLVSSSKEHRIKLNINSIVINHPTMAVMLSNPTLKREYSEDYNHWVYAYGPMSSQTGKVKVDAEDIYMAIGDYSFSSYDTMVQTNEIEVENSSGYVYVKSYSPKYEDTVVYVTEGMFKTDDKISVDTERIINSDVEYKNIHSSIGTPFFTTTPVYSGGVSIIDETIESYTIEPDELSLKTKSITFRAYRIMNGTYYSDNYENPSINEYIRLSYSIDNGESYQPLVTDSSYIATIEVPDGLKKIYFKASARTPSKDTSMNISISPLYQEVWHKRALFYTELKESILLPGKETVVIGGTRWTNYKVDISECYFDFPKRVDVKVGFKSHESNIKIGFFDEENGEPIVNGSFATIDSQTWPVVDIYVKESDTTVPHYMFITTMTNKPVSCDTDTSRIPSIPFETVYDSKRRIAVSDEFEASIYRNTIKNDKIDCGSARHVIKNDAHIPKTIRRIANTGDFDIESLRKIIKYSNIIGDSLRKLHKNSNKAMDSLRATIKNLKSVFDSKRNAVKDDDIVSDTTRRASIENLCTVDSKRYTIKSDKIESDTNKQICANVAIGSDLKRNVIKKESVELESIRKIGKNSSGVYDSRRFIANKATLLVDTDRFINVSKELIYIDTSRKTFGPVSECKDTSRVTCDYYGTIVDTNRIVGDNKGDLVIGTRRIVNHVHKETPITDANRIVIVTEEVIIKTQRTVRASVLKEIDTRKNVIHDRDYMYSAHRLVHRSTLLILDTKRVSRARALKVLDTQRTVVHKNDYMYDVFRLSHRSTLLMPRANRITHYTGDMGVDTSKHIWYKTTKPIDMTRTTLTNQAFICDTDRLPFYFVDIFPRAIRSQVYHGKDFPFDTARDKFREDMTVIKYDMKRAVNVINPHAKVYEYNIKVCNTLFFNIKM